MPKGARQRRRPDGPAVETLFKDANELWDRGELRSAFRLFLSAAKAGDPGAQHDLAYFYETGTGVKPNRKKALYWYNRAYRLGLAAAASNIGTIFREEGEFAKAVQWFRRAVCLGDADGNLEIAKIYIQRDRTRDAVPFLKKAAGSRRATKGTREEAKLLLSEARGGSRTRTR